jgi:hypothetical protein
MGWSNVGTVTGDGSVLTACVAENALVVPVQANWRADTSCPAWRLDVNTGAQSSPQSFPGSAWVLDVDPRGRVTIRSLSE